MKGKSSKGGSKHTTLQITVPFFMVLIFSIVLLSYGNHAFAYANTKEKVSADTTLLVSHLDMPIAKQAHDVKLINVQYKGSVKAVLTDRTDPIDVVHDLNISLAKNEKVYCNTKEIVDTSVIKVVKTEVIVEYKDIDIPFTTETTKTDKYMKGEQHIVQHGVNGTKVQKTTSYYEDGKLLGAETVEERVKVQPVKQIVEVGTAQYSLENIDSKGYNCGYWYSVVDSGPYTAEEKQWLKFVMYCESGCNAESTKGSYRGLFQWSPYWWSKQYTENIFDGIAQIKHTLEKYRAGAAASQWPACNKAYNEKYK